MSGVDVLTTFLDSVHPGAGMSEMTSLSSDEFPGSALCIDVAVREGKYK